MAIRLRTLLTEFITGEKAKAVDLNDTFDYALGSNPVKEITTAYTVGLSDSILVAKPSSGSNSYSNISLGGDYWYGDKNFARSGNFLYGGITTGSTGWGKIDMSTGTYTRIVAGTGNGSGYTNTATDGTYIYYTAYDTLIRRVEIATGTQTTFVTMPANVYALTRNETNGDFYACGYSGTIYKITAGGTITTHISGIGWTNTVTAIACTSANTNDNLYVTTGSASWRITSGVAYGITNVIPALGFTYVSSDTSLYYKRNIGGYHYFCKYDLSVESETVITVAQYSDNCAYYDGTYLYEGNASSPNQFSRLNRSTAVVLSNITFPTPSATYKDKNIIVTAPYAWGAGLNPILNGKFITDYPTSATQITFSYGSPWGTQHRTLRFVCDGTNWIILRT